MKFALLVALLGMSVASKSAAVDSTTPVPASDSTTASTAETPSQSSTEQPTTQPPTTQPPTTEQIALQLVRRHLPELEPMLDRLRENDAKQFKRATAELARWSRRLANAEKRDAKLYEIEVGLMKAEADVNRLTARLKVRDEPGDREQLKSATARLQRNKLARARYDVDAMTARLKRVQQQLETAREQLQAARSEIENDPDAAYTDQLRKAGRQP